MKKIKVLCKVIDVSTVKGVTGDVIIVSDAQADALCKKGGKGDPKAELAPANAKAVNESAKE